MNRKKPYSGAKKKKQLQEKRAKQRGEFPPESNVFFSFPSFNSNFLEPPQIKKGQKFPKKDLQPKNGCVIRIESTLLY